MKRNQDNFNQRNHNNFQLINQDNNMDIINQDNLYINFNNLQKQLNEKETLINKLNRDLNKAKLLELDNKKLNNDVKKKEKELQELNSVNKTLTENIKISEDEKQNLSKKLNEYQQLYFVLSNEFQLNKEKLKSKESELMKITEKLNSIKEQKSKMEIEFQKNIQILQEELTKTKNNLELKETELKKVDNQIKEKDNQIEKLSKCKKENELLKKENDSLRRVINQGETKEEYLIKPAEEFYDVIIDIKSINSLRNEGWKILHNEQRKEAYNKIIGEETMKIGVLGLNNVGKSFLLKKIAIPNLPSGYSIETKGISIKYADPKDNNDEEIKGICILDSAGFETPLLKEEKLINNNKVIIKDKKNGDELENAIKFDEIEDDLARDKAQTERFIEQLIISLSDMVILVVGKLTRTEQRLISRIKNMVKKNERNKIKSIIIVHNLAQYHKKIEVENHINYYLKKSATFKLGPKDYLGNNKIFKGRQYFYEITDDSKELQVFHYIMAKEGTEAGDYHNPFTLELIKQQYNSFNDRKPINIPDEIIKLFSELSTDIIGEKMDCQKLGKDNNLIKLVEDNQNNNAKKKTRLNVQNAYIDQDGNYLKNKGKFEPKYSLSFYKEKKAKKEDDEEDEDEDEENYDKYLLLRLEIPGNILKLTARSTDPKTEKFKGIVIKGIKKKDEFKEQSKEDFTVISDNRSYEEFSYFIELKRNLELTERGAKGSTGIYEIQFDKRNKETSFKKEAGEKDDKPNAKSLKENNNEETNKKNIKLMNIASGVYVMKFLLTQTSFIPNK